MLNGLFASPFLELTQLVEQVYLIPPFTGVILEGKKTICLEIVLYTLTESRSTLMFKTTMQISSLALVALLTCASNLDAQFITLVDPLPNPTQTVGIGPSESVSVFANVSLGPIPVDGLDLVISVSPGFPGQSQSMIAPPVIGVTGLGVFSGSSSTFTPAALSGSSFAEASLSIPTSTQLSDGLIAEISLDTTGLLDGDQFLFGFSQNTFFSNAGVPIDTGSQLTFVVTGQSVPEPSSSGILLALGTIAMVRRKRA